MNGRAGLRLSKTVDETYCFFFSLQVAYTQKKVGLINFLPFHVAKLILGVYYGK